MPNGPLALGTVGRRTGRHPPKNSEPPLPGVDGEGGWHGDGAQPVMMSDDEPVIMSPQCPEDAHLDEPPKTADANLPV